MKTIALRFGEHFAPSCGTILAHNELIKKNGFVWYGKLGNKISEQVIKEVLSADDPKILLISSGKSARYWAHISDYSFQTPAPLEYPSYYSDKSEKMKCWFKVRSFEPAPKDIMSKCVVISSGAKLGEVSKHSMSPYFIISYED